MPRVRFVKKSRKEFKTDSGEKIPVGGSYYHWKFNFSRYVHRSLTPPRPQQLTQSEFLQTIYGIGDDLAAVTKETLETDGIDSIISQIEDLSSETDDKLGNMPDSLQDSPTGEMLQNRVDALEDWRSEIENVEIPEKLLPEATDEEKKEYQEKLEQAVQELRDCMYNGE